MKFIHCKRDPHTAWGVNDPINLDHCLSYSAGTVEDGPARPKAHAIHFTMVGRPKPVVWTFVDERHCYWELGRLVELTYEPSDKDELDAICAERGIETRVSELSKSATPATLHDAGAEVVKMLATVVGKISEISKGVVDEIERGQRGAASCRSGSSSRSGRSTPSWSSIIRSGSAGAPVMSSFASCSGAAAITPTPSDIRKAATIPRSMRDV